MWAEASPNIAFIKYWGKIPASGDTNRNLATNPSLSMTLSRAQTRCSVELKTGAHEIFIQGAPARPKDQEKVSQHLRRVTELLAPGENLFFKVESANNFPQGTGIASSASAFAALTLATAGEILGLEAGQRWQKERLFDFSRLSRRGSGSASRSVAGGFLKWEGEAATPLSVEWPLRDTILIFSAEEKKVPSTEGHAAATSSPLFAERLKRLPARLGAVEEALQAKDLGRLGRLLEEEALEMHEVARSGQPSIDYGLPETWEFIRKLETLKERDFYFTLDAGPNVHLLSEKNILPDLKRLWPLERVRLWEDACGKGPRLFAKNENIR